MLKSIMCSSATSSQHSLSWLYSCNGSAITLDAWGYYI